MITKKNNFFGFIPARGGSKRVKNKNIKLFKKKPLIYYSIKSSLKSKFIDETVVYSDSDKIKYLSKKLGAEVEYDRPKIISNDSTTMYETIKFFLKKNKKYKKFKYIALLQPTSPLRNHLDIDKAVKKLLKNKTADGILSTFLIRNFNKKYPDKFMYEQNGFLKRTNVYKKNQHKKIFLRNGPAIFIFKTKSLNKDLYNLKLINYIMSEKRSLDINYPQDFKI